MAAPAPSAAPGSPQPPARPLPATCAGRGITARFPAACGHTGRALPSLLRGGGRVGPDRTRTSPATCGRGRARAGAGESLSLWLAARRGAAGRGGRAAPSARRAAGGERPPVPGRREASRAEPSRACAAAAIRLAKGEAPAGMGQRGVRAPCLLPLLLLLLLGEPGGGGRGPGQGCARP